MNDRQMLAELVRRSDQFRDTPIVDDDFPQYRDRYDETVRMAKKHLERPRPIIVCLCGSTRFMGEFKRAQFYETLDGKIVLTIGCDSKSAADLFKGTVGESVKKKLDELHKQKINLADEILVLNAKTKQCTKCKKPCGPKHFAGFQTTLSECCGVDMAFLPYIGDSTRSEIGFAVLLGKPIRYLETP